MFLVLFRKTCIYIKNDDLFIFLHVEYQHHHHHHHQHDMNEIDQCLFRCIYRILLCIIGEYLDNRNQKQKTNRQTKKNHLL